MYYNYTHLQRFISTISHLIKGVPSELGDLSWSALSYLISQQFTTTCPLRAVRGKISKRNIRTIRRETYIVRTSRIWLFREHYQKYPLFVICLTQTLAE